MGTKRVCDVGCGTMHELAIRLDKAGFNADIVQEIIESKGNKKAEAMLAAISGEIAVPKAVVPVQSAEKFALLLDLGIITVPDDYVHGTCLESFFKKNGRKLYDFNKNITDANFPNPSRILKPGDKLRVRAFHQIVSGSTTSKERMEFLEKQQEDVYVGAQGASLVFEQKRDQLLKGKWYASFDKEDRLWKDSDGLRRVPLVDAHSGGGFRVYLGYLGHDWYDDHAFLSFSDYIE